MELKDIYEITGVKPEEGKEFDTETFKEAFGKTYVGREVAKQDPELVKDITGKALGSITTAAKRLFGFENKDVEGKKVEEILQLGIDKTQKQIEELKAAGASTDDAKLKKLQDELIVRDGKIKEFETLYNNQSQEFEGFKTKVETEKKQSSISQLYSQAKSKIEFSQDVNEYTLRGFDAALQEKYKFDLSEDGKELHVLAADGSGRVKNATGSLFETVENILKAEADAAKILKKNNAAGNQGGQQGAAQAQQGAAQAQQRQLNNAGRPGYQLVSR